jgi:hypothetical protein
MCTGVTVLIENDGPPEMPEGTPTVTSTMPPAPRGEQRIDPGLDELTRQFR